MLAGFGRLGLSRPGGALDGEKGRQAMREMIEESKRDYIESVKRPRHFEITMEKNLVAFQLSSRRLMGERIARSSRKDRQKHQMILEYIGQM